MFLVPFVMDIIPVFVSVRRVAVNLQATVSTPVGSHVLAIILLFQPPVTSGHTPTTTTGFYCVNGDIPVLLQTAQAYIFRPTDPACGMIIRLMFDGGAKGYISLRELRRCWDWIENVQKLLTLKHLGQRLQRLGL